MDSRIPELSIIIPVRNEEGNVRPLLAEIEDVFRRSDIPWEVLFVDDASTDSTRVHLQALTLENPKVGVLIFDIHQGKSAALAAGIAVARGQFLAMMDGDLQNCPADLLKMVEVMKADPSIDFVQGVRKDRRDSWAKKAASRVGLFARLAVLSDPCPDSGCGLRVMTREAGGMLPLHFEGTHRLLPFLSRIRGGNVLDMPIGHRPRHAGVSKYHVGPISRGLCGFLDLLAARWMKWRLRSGSKPEVLKPRHP